jgi:hypothetical protein
MLRGQQWKRREGCAECLLFVSTFFADSRCAHACKATQANFRLVRWRWSRPSASRWVAARADGASLPWDDNALAGEPVPRCGLRDQSAGADPSLYQGAWSVLRHHGGPSHRLTARRGIDYLKDRSIRRCSLGSGGASYSPLLPDCRTQMVSGRRRGSIVRPCPSTGTRRKTRDIYSWRCRCCSTCRARSCSQRTVPWDNASVRLCPQRRP